MSLWEMHRGRRATALSWAVLAGAVGLLALAQAGQISPALDVISHLTGHLLGIGLAAAIALFIGRYHLAVLAFGAVLTLGFHTVLSLPAVTNASGSHAASANNSNQATTQGMPLGMRVSSSKGAPLKLISLNSWHSNKAPAKIATYLKEQNADVVVLIEFGPNKLGMLKQFASMGYRHQIHCARRWYCSLALVSRRPLLKAHATSPTRTRPALIWAQVKQDARPNDLNSGGTVTIIGTHAYRPSAKPRLHATHLKHLAKFIASVKGPLIMVGDFNATPWSQSYKRFLRDTGLKSAGSMLPSWPAWPLTLPQFAIDHIFISSQIAVRARGVGPYVGSDHLPLWARIDIHMPFRP